MDFQSAIEQVSQYTEGKFPESAVEYIASNKEMFEEFFIQTIRSYAHNVSLYDDGKDLHLSALLFLGQFQSQAAFPFLLELLKTLPYTEENDQPLGDGIISIAPYVLVACFDGNLSLTNDLLYSESSYLFSRVAVLEMIEVLLCLEKISLENVKLFYENLVDKLIKYNKNDEFILMCIDNLSSIFIDLSIELCSKYNIELDWVQREIDYLKTREVHNPFYLYEKDITIKNYENIIHNGMRYIKDWNMFNKSKDSHSFWEHNLKNIENIHIGRNDPCFCGSGKKYKKCCLM